MGAIYFIRHGQASFGKANYDVLSETGKTQSRILGEHFKNTDTIFDSAYTGTLERQVETARITLEAMGGDYETVSTPEFNEFDVDSHIMKNLEAILAIAPELEADAKIAFKDQAAYKRIVDRFMLLYVAGDFMDTAGRGMGEFISRVAAGIEMLAEKTPEGKRTAVFTSGGIITAALKMSLDLSTEHTIRTGWRILNSSVTVFETREGGLDLVCFNSTAHLELEKEPGLITAL